MLGPFHGENAEEDGVPDINVGTGDQGTNNPNVSNPMAKKERWARRANQPTHTCTHAKPKRRRNLDQREQMQRPQE